MDRETYGCVKSFCYLEDITPAESVYKSRGDSVVRMWVQLKRLCVCCCCCMPFSTIIVVNPGSPGLESSVLVSS